MSRWDKFKDGTSGLPRWKELWYLARKVGSEELMVEALALRDKELPAVVKPPNLLQKAANFSKAMLGFARDGFRMVPPEVAQERISLCKQCENYDNDTCRLCGCGLSAKTKIASSRCPLAEPRWHEYTATPEENLPSGENG